MIIHFIGSRSELQDDIQYFVEITNTIEKAGHELALDWVTPTHQLMESGKYQETVDEVDWQEVYKSNQGALARADAVIAEANAKSFSTGFQVANAIHQKKPVLILTRTRSLSGAFGSGLTSDFVVAKKYDKENLGGILQAFLDENTIDSKDLRFNFFIDRKIHNYLRWAAFRTGRTKAEIIRELVMKEIDKKDF